MAFYSHRLFIFVFFCLLSVYDLVGDYLFLTSVIQSNVDRSTPVDCASAFRNLLPADGNFVSGVIGNVTDPATKSVSNITALIEFWDLAQQRVFFSGSITVDNISYTAGECPMISQCDFSSATQTNPEQQRSLTTDNGGVIVFDQQFASQTICAYSTKEGFYLVVLAYFFLILVTAKEMVKIIILTAAILYPPLRKDPIVRLSSNSPLALLVSIFSVSQREIVLEASQKESLTALLYDSFLEDIPQFLMGLAWVRYSSMRGIAINSMIGSFVTLTLSIIRIIYVIIERLPQQRAQHSREASTYPSIARLPMKPLRLITIWLNSVASFGLVLLIGNMNIWDSYPFGPQRYLWPFWGLMFIKTLVFFSIYTSSAARRPSLTFGFALNSPFTFILLLLDGNLRALALETSSRLPAFWYSGLLDLVFIDVPLAVHQAVDMLENSRPLYLPYVLTYFVFRATYLLCTLGYHSYAKGFGGNSTIHAAGGNNEEQRQAAAGVPQTHKITAMDDWESTKKKIMANSDTESSVTDMITALSAAGIQSAPLPLEAWPYYFTLLPIDGPVVTSVLFAALKIGQYITVTFFILARGGFFDSIFVFLVDEAIVHLLALVWLIMYPAKSSAKSVTLGSGIFSQQHIRNGIRKPNRYQKQTDSDQEHGYENHEMQVQEQQLQQQQQLEHHGQQHQEYSGNSNQQQLHSMEQPQYNEAAYQFHGLFLTTVVMAVALCISPSLRDMMEGNVRMHSSAGWSFFRELLFSLGYFYVGSVGVAYYALETTQFALLLTLAAAVGLMSGWGLFNAFRADHRRERWSMASRSAFSSSSSFSGEAAGIGSGSTNNGHHINNRRSSNLFVSTGQVKSGETLSAGLNGVSNLSPRPIRSSPIPPTAVSSISPSTVSAGGKPEKSNNTLNLLDINIDMEPIETWNPPDQPVAQSTSNAVDGSSLQHEKGNQNAGFGGWQRLVE